jgi:hypothetical protein
MELYICKTEGTILDNVKCSPKGYSGVASKNTYHQMLLVSMNYPLLDLSPKVFYTAGKISCSYLPFERMEREKYAENVRNIGGKMRKKVILWEVSSVLPIQGSEDLSAQHDTSLLYSDGSFFHDTRVLSMCTASHTKLLQILFFHFSAK